MTTTPVYGLATPDELITFALAIQAGRAAEPNQKWDGLWAAVCFAEQAAQ